MKRIHANLKRVESFTIFHPRIKIGLNAEIAMPILYILAKWAQNQDEQKSKANTLDATPINGEKTTEMMQQKPISRKRAKKKRKEMCFFLFSS